MRMTMTMTISSMKNVDELFDHKKRDNASEDAQTHVVAVAMCMLSTLMCVCVTVFMRVRVRVRVRGKRRGESVLLCVAVKGTFASRVVNGRVMTWQIRIVFVGMLFMFVSIMFMYVCTARSMFMFLMFMIVVMSFLMFM